MAPTRSPANAAAGDSTRLPPRRRRPTNAVEEARRKAWGREWGTILHGLRVDTRRDH